jgi:hypothetical protein
LTTDLPFMPREIAPIGQTAWQLPHPTHFLIDLQTNANELPEQNGYYST